MTFRTVGRKASLRFRLQVRKIGEQNGDVDWVHLPWDIYTHFVLEGKVRSRASGG